MRKYKLFLLLWMAVFVPSAWATYSVHDSVTYIHDTVKAIQDELYQQMDIDYQIEQLGKTGQILKTGIDTLKVAQDTYSTCKDMFDTAVNISNYIGDPQKLVSYMNSEFWHEDEISAALNITREALDMADSKVANTGNIEYMLRQVDYSLADAEVQRSENLAETQKGALAVHKFMSEWGPKALLQLQGLNREDQKFNGRDSNMTELQYAAYKNGIWQSNTLGQLLATQTMHSAMVARQMYSDNLRLDEADLKKAKSIHDARQINESGVSALESKGSIGNNFIENFINR
ncbi:MAG: hypothetical protein PHV82_08445 [Victivallaceae bacterium]|nr:hypothetical protein [Victivallaceae bacterium]